MAKKNQNIEAGSAQEKKLMIGPALNFASAEAYKTLRTNILFSFPAEERSHVIGVTSTFKGEGKSLTAINLAYTLAEAGHRVLLVECDMRIPNIASRIGLKPVPGLSNLLVNINTFDGVVQRKIYRKNGEDQMMAFDVITAGNVPPNPSELLQSNRMKQLIEALKESYNIIILDLPPVTVVTDALVVSGFTSGLVVVVRNERASKRGLSETMRQLRQVNIKILGFVFTNADVTRSKSYSKYYKKDYYYKKK